MDRKVLIYGGLIVIILVIVLISLGVINFSGKVSAAQVTGSNQYSNLPEKCRPTAGQDIESWKEHLGHHAETKECLNYFK